MAFASTLVWQVQTDGISTNGGGFDPTSGTPGTDYSQQASPQITFTDLVIDPTTNTNCTSVANPFTSAHVGNVVNITGGTGFTVQRVQIMSVSAGIATMDKSLGTLSSVSGAGKLGGALAAMGNVGAIMIAGNRMWVKAGTYSLGATDTVSSSGTSTSPILITGYTTTRSGHGDAYLGRTNSGVLITTNMPTYAYQATFRYNGTGNFIIIESINFTGNVSNYLVTNDGTDTTITNCTIAQSSTNAAASGLFIDSNRDWAFNCDIICSGTTGGNSGYGVNMAGTGCILDSCRISLATSNTFAVAVSFGSVNTIFGNQIFATNGAGIGVTPFSTSSSAHIRNNTIVGFVRGISILASTTGLSKILGNMITDNTTYAIDFNNVNVAAVLAYNRYRDVTTINLGTGYVTATNYSPVTTDTGGPETDYTAYALQDFRLIPTSPGVGVNWFQSASIGALQLGPQNDSFAFIS